MAFLADLESNVLQLQRELVDGTWRPGPPRSFWIRDPKPRLISAAPFRDRVVHHALCAEIGPLFEAVASDCSHACRKGRGTATAIAAARKATAAHERYHKIDVQHYFESVEHDVLLACIARHVADADVLRLLELVVRAGAPGSPPGRGMPIGNLTSQHFANLILTEVDQFAVASPGVAAYVRYMDDMLLFGARSAELAAAGAAIAAFVRDHLRLALNPRAERHGRCADGVPFLGLRMFPGLVRLDAARRRRLLRRLAAADALAQQGDEALAASRATALTAWAATAQTVRLRQLAANRRTA
ncbi:MAG: RNA-dependent DNA polymerase [Deltaproteobacteria bacterium]|nr:RNA-dependent DNA polymerase [Deltaproteobacteria bacterium]